MEACEKVLVRLGRPRSESASFDDAEKTRIAALMVADDRLVADAPQQFSDILEARNRRMKPRVEKDGTPKHETVEE